MNRRNTIGDSVESVNQVVYHRNVSQPARDERAVNVAAPTVVNGSVMKKDKTTRAGSTSSDSEFAGVTINFNTDTKGTTVNNTSTRQSTNSEVSTLPSSHQEMSPIGETVAEKTLPWQDSGDPSPTHLADNIPNNEPVIAHVPTWVNNLSYSHITETGSPYVSPQTTIIPPPSDYHKTVYSIFPRNDDNSDSNIHNGVTSDSFPTPWNTNNAEDCPIVSPMVVESSARSEDLLHSTHMEQAPDHHHVIVPSLHHIESSNSSGHHKAHLTEVASAPDFQHWKPLGGFLNESSRYNYESDTMLSEMAFVEGVKSRVAEWLKQADDEEENDADEENDEPDGLKSAVDLERELDLQMNGYRLQSSKAK